MKKVIKKSVSIIIALILFTGTGLTSINVFASETQLSDEQLLSLEEKGCFDFFWKEANTDSNSAGYGLIKDRAKNDSDTSTTSPNSYSPCSVASVGFGLNALVIGSEEGWISKQEAHDRALGTLNTLLNNAEQINGFFYHFLDMDTAKRFQNSEVSVIDTALAVNGAITAGEYFGSDVMDVAQQIYDRVDWPWYLDPSNNQFYMGYTPEKGFAGHWDFSGEQLQLYVLGAGSSTHPIDPSTFYSFTRHFASYGNYPKFIHSWFGSIFTHQFSHTWINFYNKIDNQGVNWWSNSVIASKSSRQFAIDQHSTYKTLGADAWGLTASDGPKGYSGLYGSNPSGFGNDQTKNDGTLTPCGALGSIVFTPEETISALRNFYDNYPNLWGKYGLKDAYNADLHDAYPSEYATNTDWYDSDVIGIDKGITISMIDNYKNSGVWKYYMQDKNVQAGINRVGLRDIGSLIFDDFEGDSLNSGWSDGGDNVYTIKSTDEQSYTGLNSLKINFNKNGNAWSFMKTTVSGTSVSNGNLLTARVYNTSSSPLNILLKFETNNGNHEQTFTVNSSNEWDQITWDISSFKNDLANIKDVLIFAAPGDSSATGSLYIDDINIHTSKLGASNVLIEGKPIVGETLKASYDYYNLDNVAEGDSQYSWLISDTKDGTYSPIDGAKSKLYTITSDDVGKYIKFKVIPVSMQDSNGVTYTGSEAYSGATNIVEVATPVAQNVTITKQPVDNSVNIDKFDSDSIKSNWADSGDGCYTLSMDKVISQDGSLKVKYDKKSSPWGFFYYKFDSPQDFSNTNLLALRAYGNASLKIKFEDADGAGIRENDFTINSDSWTTLSWDLSGFNSKLKNVGRILIFAAPGNTDVTGEFYLDDLQITQRTIEDVTKDSIPVVGEKINASYMYHDAKGDAEGDTAFRWLISDSKDGKYSIIDGATEKIYTLKQEDKDKYVKVEITPMTIDKIAGSSYVSSASNKITDNASGNLLSMTTTNPPNGTIGTAYSYTFTSTGGTGSKTYAVTGGSLPAGLNIAADGILSGTPEAVGTSTFEVTAKDSVVPPVSSSHTFNVDINGILTEIPVKIIIEGNKKVGNTLSAQFLDANGSVTTTSSAVTYNWYRLSSPDSEGGKEIGHGKTYELVSADGGKYIKIIAKFDDKKFEYVTSNVDSNITSNVNSNANSNSNVNSNVNSNATSKSEKKSSHNSSSSSSSRSSSSTEEINTDVTDGSGNSLSQTKVERITASDGTKKDTVNYTEGKAQETVKELAKEGKDIARIVIPDPKNEVSETKVNIMSGTLSVLSIANINLEIDTENARISLPKQTIQDLSKSENKDLYFILVPIKNTAKQQEIQANANKEAIIKVVSGNNSVQTLGKPIAIETNMSGREVNVTLPLKDINIPTDLTVRDAFLKDLGIYIEHSDGTPEFVKGEIVEYSPGVYGIKFTVTKFSNFTIIKLNQPTVLSGTWQNTSDGWKYIENGVSITGWKQINGSWYLMNPAGIMETGWKYVDGLWYFLKSDGAMATGWKEVNGKWYYLYSNGSMASNAIIEGYALDGSGAWVS